MRRYLAALVVLGLTALALATPGAAHHRPGHERTPTSTPAARVKATATATATSLPTATAAPAHRHDNHNANEQANGNSTAGSSVLSASTLPACAHDVLIYHGLVERDGSGAITCTYGHEHKDDPSDVDDIFGPAAYGSGHPWATTGENVEDGKHRFYGWLVQRDLACIPNEGLIYALSAFRALGHWDGHAAHTTRIHSAILDAELCSTIDPTYSGLLQMGAHVDYGNLELEGVGHVPQAQDQHPVCGGIDSNTKRTHGTPDNPRARFIWYGANTSCTIGQSGTRVVTLGAFSMLKEEWGPIDPASMNNPLLFYTCPPIGSGCPFNGSHLEPMHSIRVSVGRAADSLDGLTDGRLTWTGFTTRWGYRAQGCAGASVDCIPFRAVNVVVGQSYAFRRDQHPGLGIREYDVTDPATGESLIEYPN